MKSKLEWLEEREEKLYEIEKMIEELQFLYNNDFNESKLDDMRMKIFELWYFERYDKKYGSED